MNASYVRPKMLVKAGLFESEEEAIEAGLAAWLEAHPDLRIELAVHEYATDEDWSLAGAAELAGITFWDMKDILVERGVPLRLGPATVEEAQQEIETMRRWMRERRR